MGKKLTNDIFLSRVKENYGNQYTVLTPYTRGHEKVLVRHNECGFEWEIDPWNLIQGQIKKCPMCSDKWRRSQKDYEEEIHRITNGEFEVVSEYKNQKTPVAFRHKKCGNVFYKKPMDFRRSLNCPHCSGIHRNQSTESFQSRLNDMYGERYKLLGEYTKARNKIKVECLRCGNIFFATPDSLVSGHGCPKCVCSRGEDIIENWLKENGFTYEKQYCDKRCRDIRALRFDFAVFEESNLKLLIEFDGVQHYRPTRFNSLLTNTDCENQFSDTQRKDRIKDSFCKENGIPLLRISYKKIDDIHTILKDNTVLSSIEKV